MRKPTFTLVLFHIAFFAHFHIVSAQDNSISDLSSAGEDAYQVLISIYSYDQGIPLDARIIDSMETPEYHRDKIVFQSVRDNRVPGYLAIPITGVSPFPVVLQLHYQDGSKESWWEKDNLSNGEFVTEALLSSGFAVFSLDAQYHGERIIHNDYQRSGELINKGWNNRIREMVMQSTIDYRRAIDYLRTRTELDTSRIGAIGYSMGGWMSFILTAVDNRIKTTVVCVPPLFTKRFFESLARRPSDAIESRLSVLPTLPHIFASRIEQAPFVMLMGETDNLYTREEANAILRLIKSPVKEIHFYDSGHKLPKSYVPKAVEWFQTYLK